MKKKKHPKFNVLNAGSGKRGKKRVKDRWRRPRGSDNKKRVKKRWAGALPKIGYKNPEEIRGNHPRGLKEVLVYNAKDIEANKGKNVLLRFASSIGRKKREKLYQLARDIGLDIVNYKLKVNEKEVSA